MTKIPVIYAFSTINRVLSMSTMQAKYVNIAGVSTELKENKTARINSLDFLEIAKASGYPYEELTFKQFQKKYDWENEPDND